MKKGFILLQLFGDPTGDPQPRDPNPTGTDPQTPGSGDDASPTTAEMLLEFRKKHVPIEEYNKEKERADSYLQAILENREEEIAIREGGAEGKLDADEIAKKMFVPDNGMTDLEYIQNALNLRKARMAAGERDPFLPDNFDEKDVEIAQNVADVFEECVKLANGDNASFIGILQGKIKDAPIVPRSSKNLRR